MDEFGDPCGVGLLSGKYGRVDLELDMGDVKQSRVQYQPQSRRTIFGEELGYSMVPMATKKRFEEKSQSLIDGN